MPSSTYILVKFIASPESSRSNVIEEHCLTIPPFFPDHIKFPCHPVFLPLSGCFVSAQFYSQKKSKRERKERERGRKEGRKGERGEVKGERGR